MIIYHPCSESYWYKIIGPSPSNPHIIREPEQARNKSSIYRNWSVSEYYSSFFLRLKRRGSYDYDDVHTTSFTKANSSCVSTGSSHHRRSGRQRRARPECNTQCAPRTIHSGDFDSNRIFSGLAATGYWSSYRLPALRARRVRLLAVTPPMMDGWVLMLICPDSEDSEVKKRPKYSV